MHLFAPEKASSDVYNQLIWSLSPMKLIQSMTTKRNKKKKTNERNGEQSRAQKREWISVDSFHSNGAKTPAWLYQQTNKQKINKEIPESKCTARRTYIKIEEICACVCGLSTSTNTRRRRRKKKNVNLLLSFSSRRNLKWWFKACGSINS